MRRRKFETLERRKKVAARYLRGEMQWQIAQAFEVATSTITRDLQAIHQEWLAESVRDRGVWVGELLAKIDETERQAWAAWTKSQENAEVLRAKVKGNQQETEKISRGQAGDPRFLELVLKCVERRAILLGLEVPAAKPPSETQLTQVRLVRADDFYLNADRLPAAGA